MRSKTNNPTLAHNMWLKHRTTDLEVPGSSLTMLQGFFCFSIRVHSALLHQGYLDLFQRRQQAVGPKGLGLVIIDSIRANKNQNQRSHQVTFYMYVNQPRTCAVHNWLVCYIAHTDVSCIGMAWPPLLALARGSLVPRPSHPSVCRLLTPAFIACKRQTLG